MPDAPDLFIIAGPNGAGKTTYARRFLPEETRTREFVNADMIAAGLSPFAPDRAAFEAGRIMLRRLRELTARRESFSFETTLSGRAYAPLLREMCAAGYRVSLDFLWIPQLDITRNRVRQRVRKGGHDIPDDVQERRFLLGIQNLATLYRPLLSRWRLYDNLHDNPQLIAQEENGCLDVKDPIGLARIENTAHVVFMTDEGSTNEMHEKHSVFTPDAHTRASMRAMRKAYADAVLENLRFGLPVIQYHDGKVVEVPAEQLAPRARRILEANGEFLPEEIAAGKTW